MFSSKTIAIFFIAAFVSVQAATNPNVATSILQWSDAAFSTLMKSVTASSFSTDKLEAIKAGISSSPFGLAGDQVTQLYNSFTASSDILALTQIIQNNIYDLTCQQIATILNTVGFSSDELDVLKSLAPYISDRANKQTILNAFTSSSDQAQASQIIASSKSECYLFGEPQGKIAFLIDLTSEVYNKFTLPDGTVMTTYDVLKNELARTLQGLDANDQFTVIPFDGKVYSDSNPLVQATQDNINKAIANMDSWYPNNNYRATSDAILAAFQIPGVQSAYLVTYDLPNSGTFREIPQIMTYVKGWYASNPVTINTIGLMMGPYQNGETQATESFLQSVASATGGSYKGIIYQ